jgi:Cu/Ag efflux protein CusF
MRVAFAKKLLIFAVAALFLVAFTNPALAKGSLMSLKGVVSSVDTTAKTLTVKEKKGEATIIADEATKVTMGKEKKSFEDLKAGEHVTVKYQKKEGKLLARDIAVANSHGGKMEKAPEMAPQKGPEKHG